MFQSINSLPSPWNVLVYVLAAILVACAITLLYIFRKKPFVKRFLYHLVCMAEQTYGSKTGQVKFNAVYVWFCAKCPLIALFIPESLIDKWIEEAVQKMKEFLLKNGANLDSTAAAQPDVPAVAAGGN